MILAVFSAVVFSLVGWRFFYLINGYPEKKAADFRLVSGFSQITERIGKLAPKNLAFSPVRRIASRDGRYDFLSQASNPNGDWLAVFDYCFSADQKSCSSRSGFVFPGQKRHLLGLGQEDSNADLNIFNLRWERIANFSKNYQEQFDFQTADEEFIPGRQPGDPNQLAFQLTNNSGFSYWEVGIQVFLFSGGEIVSVNSITLEELKAGQSQPVRLYWHNQLPRIDGFEIIPVVNIFNQNNIMSPEKGVGDYS